MANAKVRRFLLRLPGALHDRLRREAAREGVSLNELCVRRLSTPRWPDAVSRDATSLVATASDMFGDGLHGVIVFGSWARGTASDASDVDLLIVVDPSIALTRELYREWDRRPLAFDGRVVDAHVVHLPQGPPRAGVWCDAAIDGLVLHDASGAVSRRLTEVRRAIADGRLLRRVAHGHAYWVEAA